MTVVIAIPKMALEPFQVLCPELRSTRGLRRTTFPDAGTRPESPEAAP
ncbi:MAG: hypothetical protein QOF58_878 [Pseudonocardiales bacterium]|nr:hypothetical protein [Pseudonocardiales bacterium]